MWVNLKLKRKDRGLKLKKYEKTLHFRGGGMVNPNIL
jgi:hypothetical protein